MATNANTKAAPAPETAMPAPAQDRVKKSAFAPKKRKHDFIKPTDIIRVRGNVDRPMLIIILILVCFGCIMVFSASYPIAHTSKGDSYYFIKRHLLFAIGGIVAMFVAAHFDYRWMHKLVVPYYIFTYGLLGLVLLTGVASGVAKRWIVLGPITLQPSELMKLALVLLLASYAAKHQEKIIDYTNIKRASITGTLIPIALVGFSVLPVVMEKHLSGTLIIVAIGFVVIFSSGALKRWFVLAAFAVGILVALAALTPYVQSRLDTFFNYEKYWNIESGEIHDDIWQTVQGLIAVGSGGIFGVGLGNSRQKHSFLPMPHNDFIFAIISEELGMIGALCVILLFMLFIWRGFTIARRAPDTFSSLVVIGITTQVGIQALLNIAVVTNMIPNTGVSLPFFSYGGTSLLMLLGEMGMILSISRYSYQKQ